MKQRSDIVSASEIADWAWCPEAWRLRSIGHAPGNPDVLKRGEEHHARKAVFEERSGSTISFGWWLIALGGLVAILLAYALVMG